jgi:hypothetical protein
MRSLCRLAVAAALVLAVLPASAAAAAAPAPSKLASATLIRQRDLGSGWHQSAAAPHKPPALACPGSGGKHVVQALGRAASPTFAQSQSGPFAFEIGAVFGSAASAGRWWAEVVDPGLRSCFERVLAASSGGGVKLRATGSRVLALHGAPAGLERYRVTGEATSSGDSTPVVFDVLLVRRGGHVAELQLSSFQSPPADALELQLARAVIRRLAAS